MRTEFTVTMFSKSDCPFCDAARAFLDLHEIPRVEIKHDDVAERQAMYDSLGLVGERRTVPQIILTVAAGPDVKIERYHIAGARELMMSGIQSLFHKGPPINKGPVAASVAINGELAAQMVLAEEGPSCCQ